MKTVVVTGGCVRLGAAISARMSASGWRVITTSHRPDAGADVVADLSSPSGAAHLYSKVIAMLDGNPPDALVNNAALYRADASSIDAVNRIAPEKLTILMASREYGRGAVVNVLDTCVFRQRAEGDYEKSKAAMFRYTRSSALEFAGTLRVNAVAPGAVLPPVGISEKARETLFDRPSAADVAEAVRFLIEASSTTGCVIPVDAGEALLEDPGT